jgi:hypothetical protein
VPVDIYYLRLKLTFLAIYETQFRNRFWSTNGTYFVETMALKKAKIRDKEDRKLPLSPR